MCQGIAWIHMPMAGIQLRAAVMDLGFYKQRGYLGLLRGYQPLKDCVTWI
jgi:hypothetical protein